jgi:uncharacterized membrane protein YphA (DoxX/SURF4 family)
MRRYAFAALWLALAVQVAWMIGDALVWHSPGGKLGYDLGVVVLTGAFAAAGGRWRWPTVVVRVAIALGFAFSVADRFGLLGPVGTPGVSWGDWNHFVAYTHSVNAFLPASAAPVLASLATACELGLTVTLLLGLGIRAAALGAAALTLTYAIAMTVSLPAYAQFQYAVLPISAASWALATVDVSPLSLESLTGRPRWLARPAHRGEE